MASIEPNSAPGQRLDRWLWAARWFKTRAVAVDAINNGRVELNGVRAKPAKVVRPGDFLVVRRPPYVHEIDVHGLSDRRLSAPLAAALYSERDTSIQARTQLRETLKQGAVLEQRGAGKLNKRDRRQREQLKRDWGRSQEEPG